MFVAFGHPVQSNVTGNGESNPAVKIKAGAHGNKIELCELYAKKIHNEKLIISILCRPP
jgi:hypothetical protein